MALSTLSSANQQVGDWLEPGLRFLHYGLLLGLFGWAAFRVIGLRKLGELPRSKFWGAVALCAAVAAPLVSILLMLTSIASMMGQRLTQLDRLTVEAMVLGTSIGWAFLGRTALLILALLPLMFRGRTALALPAAAFCYAAALMTLGWSGHAAATEGGLGLFHRLSNGIHLLAAGLWLGAIGWFLHLTSRAHRMSNGKADRQLLAVMHRFAPLGVTLVAVVAITGLINGQIIVGLENAVEMFSTSYGALLAVKVALVTGMLAFGAHNAKVGRRHASQMQSEAADVGASLASLRRCLVGEFGLGIGVIALVAILGMLPPMPMP